MSKQEIIKERDIIKGKSDAEILDFMGSGKQSLAGSDIIDEDNLLFYVDPSLVSINDELKDYFYGELHYDEITFDDIRDKITVYQSQDNDLYAIWNN